jgi:hypothetical protein
VTIRGRRGWWSALALLGLVVASAGLAQTSSGQGLLRDVGFSRAPSFTELAFTRPQNLPTKLTSKHASINVSFGIHNVSGSFRAYSWSITTLPSDQNHPKAAGVVRLPAQGQASVDRSLQLSCVQERLQVVVRLASPAESIDFWVACPSHSRSVP